MRLERILLLFAGNIGHNYLQGVPLLHNWTTMHSLPPGSRLILSFFCIVLFSDAALQRLQANGVYLWNCAKHYTAYHCKAFIDSIKAQGNYLYHYFDSHSRLNRLYILVVFDVGSIVLLKVPDNRLNQKGLTTFCPYFVQKDFFKYVHNKPRF